MRLTAQDLESRLCSREDAFHILSEIRPFVTAAGYELALYGSVLRDGLGNDLDLFAVPTVRRYDHEASLVNALYTFAAGPYHIGDAARGRRHMKQLVRVKDLAPRLLDIIILPDPPRR